VGELEGIGGDTIMTGNRGEREQARICSARGGRRRNSGAWCGF